jgi:hypothetical protein
MVMRIRKSLAILTLGALLALTATAPAAWAATQGNGIYQEDGGLTGTWLVTLTFPPSNPPLPTTTAVLSVAGGGVAALVDINPPGTATGLGSWRTLVGHHSFVATLWQTTNIAGPTLAVKVRITGIFTENDIRSTTDTFEVFLPADLTNPVAIGTASVSGNRIVA